MTAETQFGIDNIRKKKEKKSHRIEMTFPSARNYVRSVSIQHTYPSYTALYE